MPVLRLDPKGFELTAAHVLVSLASWRWPLVVAALVAALGAALLAGGLRGALVHVGLAIAGGGLLVAAVVAGLGEFVAAHAAHAANLDEDAERDAIRAVWSALFGDLRSAALIAALGGALLAAIASVALPAVDPGAGWRWVRGAALVVVADREDAARSGAHRCRRGDRLRARAAGTHRRRGGRRARGDPRPRPAVRDARAARGGRRLRGRWRTPATEAVGARSGRRPRRRRDRPGDGDRPARAADRAGRGRGRARRLQRAARDVRPPPGPGRHGRDPQLLRGGRRAGLAVRQPALRDRTAAARRDPRAAHRRPPRRAGSEERAHPDRPGGRGIGPQQGRARAQPRRAAHRRPPRRQGGCGQTRRAAPAVSLPHAVRARGRAARRAADDHPPLPHRQPAGGGRAVRGALRPGRDDRGLAPRDGPAVGGARSSTPTSPCRRSAS